jgi:hypothetical protein
MRRVDGGIIFPQERSRSRIGTESDATLQLQIVGDIIDPTEFVEQVILGNVDGLGHRPNRR